MPAALTRFRTFYGAHPLHLLAVLASFALLGYIISVAGPATFWNPAVWWQSILVWFLGAALLHDLVLFPLYALGDRLHTAGVHTLRRRRGHHPDRPPHVSAINYVRVPVLASGLMLLVFLPGHHRTRRPHLPRGYRSNPGALPRPLAAVHRHRLRAQRGGLRGPLHPRPTQSWTTLRRHSRCRHSRLRRTQCG